MSDSNARTNRSGMTSKAFRLSTMLAVVLIGGQVGWSAPVRGEPSAPTVGTLDDVPASQLAPGTGALRTLDWRSEGPGYRDRPWTSGERWRRWGGEGYGNRRDYRYGPSYLYGNGSDWRGRPLWPYWRDRWRWRSERYAVPWRGDQRRWEAESRRGTWRLHGDGYWRYDPVPAFRDRVWRWPGDRWRY
jgi:hypothetical protein